MNSLPKKGVAMGEMMKVIVGYDGSECADAALGDLHRAGLPAGCHVLVISVADVIYPIVPVSEGEGADTIFEPALIERTEALRQRVSKMEAEAVALADQARDRLRAEFPQWQIESEAYCDAPAWAIIRRADEWQPDLIVVGSHGRSAFGRMVLGSVSQKVLYEARSSVRIARGRGDQPPAAGEPVRLLLGVDGSPDAENLLNVVAARSWPAGSAARVLMASEPLRPSLLGRLLPPVKRAVAEISQDEERWARGVVEAAVEKLRAAGLEAEGDLHEGDPRRVLLEEAENWRADTIFVGARGLSGVERFLLGSVSSHVAARAQCSVEVVRPANNE